MHEYVKFVPVYRNRHTGVSEHGKERFLGIISRILAHAQNKNPSCDVSLP